MDLRAPTPPRKGESWGVRLFLGLRLHCLRQSVRAQSFNPPSGCDHLPLFREWCISPPVLVVEDVP